MQPKIDMLLAGLKTSDCYQVWYSKHLLWLVRTSHAIAKLLRQSQPPIKSDANGEFRLTGFVQDQLAEITFAAERIEAQKVFVLGRQMETQRIPCMEPYPNRSKDVYHGTKFTSVIGPSIPVRGVVTEFQSRKPITNAIVYVERLLQERNINADNPLRVDTKHIHTVTDAAGRFTLHGIPLGEGHVLWTLSPKFEPWLIAKNVFPLRADDKDHEVNVHVFRGIWLEGQVTDGKTKEPLSGYVDYLALQKNPNIPDVFGLEDGWEIFRFPVDKFGHYRVPGLPSPGVLLAKANGATQYPLSVGAENVDGYKSGSLASIAFVEA